MNKMRYLFLFLICFMLCGCRTFTSTELNCLTKQYFYAGMDVGYKEGYKSGFKVGEIIGHIDEIKYQSDKIMEK